MKRLYYSDASDTPPSPPKNPITNQYPQDGNRAKKQMPTVIGAYWYHMITEEFMAVIDRKSTRLNSSHPSSSRMPSSA